VCETLAPSRSTSTTAATTTRTTTTPFSTSRYNRVPTSSSNLVSDLANSKARPGLLATDSLGFIVWYDVLSIFMLQKADHYWSTEPCKLGYKRDAGTGYCVDIDECLVGPGCRDHEKCTNTPGGYDCSSLCSTGWYFSTITKGCQDVDECLLGRHDCPQGTHRCVCARARVYTLSCI